MTIKMLGQLCVIKFQNLSNLCIEHVQKRQIETVVSTLKLLYYIYYIYIYVYRNTLLAVKSCLHLCLTINADYC